MARSVGGTPYTHAVPDRLSTITEALARVATANLALRRCLEENQTLLDEAADLLDSGTGLAVVLLRLPVLELESASNDAVTELFHARKYLRKVVVRAAVDDGMPVQQLATLLEISPSLIASYVLEQPLGT